jgi:hypothetical protein
VSRRKRRSSLFDIVADEVSSVLSLLSIWAMNHTFKCSFISMPH